MVRAGRRSGCRSWRMIFAKAPLPLLTRLLGAFLILLVVWRHMGARSPANDFAQIRSLGAGRFLFRAGWECRSADGAFFSGLRIDENRLHWNRGADYGNHACDEVGGIPAECTASRTCNLGRPGLEPHDDSGVLYRQAHSRALAGASVHRHDRSDADCRRGVVLVERMRSAASGTSATMSVINICRAPRRFSSDPLSAKKNAPSARSERRSPYPPFEEVLTQFAGRR